MADMTNQMTDERALEVLNAVTSRVKDWPDECVEYISATTHLAARLRTLSEPADKGPWKRDGLKFYSDDFTHDAMLTVDGDFSDADRERYATWLLSVLNGAPALSEQQGEAVGFVWAEPQQGSADRKIGVLNQALPDGTKLYARPQAAGDAVRIGTVLQSMRRLALVIRKHGTCAPLALDHLSDSLEAALSAAPAQAVPDGWVLVPAKFGISADAWESAQCAFGGQYVDVETQTFFDCTAWVGYIENDDGSKIHGLHISCDECPEEGSTTLSEFAAAPNPGADPQGDE